MGLMLDIEDIIQLLPEVGLWRDAWLREQQALDLAKARPAPSRAQEEPKQGGGGDLPPEPEDAPTGALDAGEAILAAELSRRLKDANHLERVLRVYRTRKRWTTIKAGAALLGMSQPTFRHYSDILVARGLLETRPGMPRPNQRGRRAVLYRVPEGAEGSED